MDNLKQLGITHIVNCASPVFKDGKEITYSKLTSVHLDASYYRGIGIKKENYLSISVLDWPSFDISQFFESTASFIDSVISPNGEAASCDSSALHKEVNSGKVVVHCVQGKCRSATIVIAYLLLRTRDPFPSLEEAIRFVKSQRDIFLYGFGLAGRTKRTSKLNIWEKRRTLNMCRPLT